MPNAILKVEYRHNCGALLYAYWRTGDITFSAMPVDNGTRCAKCGRVITPYEVTENEYEFQQIQAATMDYMI